jgi:glycosyltransferase involved in cell wall biosynthesis
VNKVSVILPTHNRAELLKRSIQSILDQTYEDFELIVIDDASKDDTEAAVKGFNDDRIRYIKQQINIGAAAARNAGIAASKGEYIAFQDDDDEWLPTKLEKQVAVFEMNRDQDLGLVYSNMWEVYGNKRTETRPERIMPEDGIVFDRALNGKLRRIGIQTALIKRECFDKAGGFDPEFPRWIDHEFFIRVSRYYHFYHIDEPLVNWHSTQGGISSSKLNLIAARKLLIRKYSEDLKKRSNRGALAQYCYDIGHTLCLQGDMEEGRLYIVKAIVAAPWRIDAIIALPFTFLGPKLYKRLHPV